MRYAHAVYCDDIRQEVGNKTSLIGLYSGQLSTSEFPCALPKLCIVISVSTPKDEMFGSLSLAGTYCDVEIFKMEMDKEQIQAVIDQTPKLQEVGKFFMVQVMAILSPFHLEKPGMLRLNLMVDGEKLHCAGLEVIQI
jgi:hypothetical protein